MSWIARVLGPALAPPLSLNAGDERLWTPFGGQPTASGVRINEETALTISTVYACVRVISETCASLPLLRYRRLPAGGKSRAPDRLYRLMHDQPNPWQTAFEFREMLTAHCLLYGNGFARIVPAADGYPVGALVPIHPERVQIEQIAGGYAMKYRVQHADGSTETIEQDRMFHLRGLSLDGLLGLSVISYARESLGLNKALEQSAARLMRRGARPSGVLRHKGQLSEAAGKRLTASWDAAHGGEASGGTALLEEDMDWKPAQMTNVDAQTIETRLFQRRDVPTWFRMPPHKVGIMDNATFTNIEHQALEFVTDTIRPWLVRWEQAILRDIETEYALDTADQYFFEHLVDGLLRGDIKSRYDAYAVARNWGWMNVDEIRERENLNPLPDGQGQIYLQPLNMIEAGSSIDDRARAGGSGSSRSAAALRFAVAEQAGRLLQRERAVVLALGRKHAGDATGEYFATALDEFYDAHASRLVAELHLSTADARRYCERHRVEVAGAGVTAVERWDDAMRELAELARVALMEAAA